MSKPIYIIIGTRAQFIKVAPMLKMMRDQDKKYTLIYSAQHKETINEILEVYHLPKPVKVLYHFTEANTRILFLKWFFTMLPIVFFKAKKYLPEPGIVLTHGDTFTTWLAAIMGKIAGCKVGHLESGLRSFNLFKPFPEEISRLITFRFTNVYFCPNEWAINNLKKYKGEKINLGVNPIYDAVRYALDNKEKRQFDFQKEKYALVSIHRYENIFSKRLTKKILPVLHKISEKMKLIFVLHPSTRERLKSLGLLEQLQKEKNIFLHERFDYIDWINVCGVAEFIITDGGSNQEELSYLGIPAILFRTETERNEGLGENIILSGLNEDIIYDFVKNYPLYKRDFKKVEVSPSQIVINYLND